MFEDAQLPYTLTTLLIFFSAQGQVKGSLAFSCAGRFSWILLWWDRGSHLTPLARCNHVFDADCLGNAPCLAPKPWVMVTDQHPNFGPGSGDLRTTPPILETTLKRFFFDLFKKPFFGQLAEQGGVSKMQASNGAELSCQITSMTFRWERVVLGVFKPSCFSSITLMHGIYCKHVA